MRIILFFLLSLYSSSYAQSFLNANDFKKKTASDIVVVEFWSDWNSSNEVEYLGKLNCKTYRLDIAQHPAVQSKNKVSILPTVIIYDNGKEVFRYEADLSFRLDATKSEIQAKIDEIQMQKF